MNLRCTIWIAALLGMAAAGPALAASNMENEFLWNEASIRLSSAGSESDFVLAAGACRKLLRNGVRNGPLFYNMGVALLKARRYEEALASLERAERYMGSNPEIRRNMLLAIARDKDPGRASLAWYRYLLFWHYELPAGSRMTLTVLAFAAVWLGLSVRALGWRRPARYLIALSLLVLAFYGSSITATILQESEAGSLAGRMERPLATTRTEGMP